MNSKSRKDMEKSRAKVSTVHASRYLQQLCKHWAHKFETEYDSINGRIALPLGEARLIAEPESLVIDLATEDVASLATLREIVTSHIERFAFRETLRFDWE